MNRIRKVHNATGAPSSSSSSSGAGRSGGNGGNTNTGATSANTSNNNDQSSRSCEGCHRRKVRCDRKKPCTNCTRAGWTCTYPTLRKDSSNRKIQSLEDIVSRLERLESLFLAGERPNQTEEEFQGQRDDNYLEPDLQEVEGLAGPLRTTRYSQAWEILLDDRSRTQYVNNANILDLLQDVIRKNLPLLL